MKAHQKMLDFFICGSLCFIKNLLNYSFLKKVINVIFAMHIKILLKLFEVFIVIFSTM